MQKCENIKHITHHNRTNDLRIAFVWVLPPNKLQHQPLKDEISGSEKVPPEDENDLRIGDDE